MKDKIQIILQVIGDRIDGNHGNLYTEGEFLNELWNWLNELLEEEE